MTDDRDDLAEANALAAEYASGLLDGTELDDARRRVAADPAFALEVARWRGRLASLHGEVADIAPPAGLWGRIESALGHGQPANDNVAALHRTLTFWRSATAGATALAASLALILLVQPRNAPVAPQAAPVRAAEPMVALVGNDSATKVMVSWDPSARQLVFAVAGALPGDARHSHELWVIPAGGTPRSLGTLSADKQSHKRLADELAKLLQQGATIAISVEPRGGSPTGAPTGPVIASGSLTPA
jgi:anti-sigma-K factor RskA